MIGGNIARTYEAGEMPKPLEDVRDGRKVKKEVPRRLVGGGALRNLVVDEDRAESREISEDGATDKDQSSLAGPREGRIGDSD